MPLIYNNNDMGCHLGMWKVEEDFDTLYSQVCLNQDDYEVLNNFNNPDRKVEWLSVRALLKNLINKDTGIYYDNRRKPYLVGNSRHISISHSYKLTSVLLSKEYRVGIDLEYMSHRIDKISDRFMNKNEYITNDMELQRYHMYIHWCAKEALYKICDKNGLNFKINLLIDHFEPANEGEISGKVLRDNLIEKFDLKYFKFDNYIIVWCIK